MTKAMERLNRRLYYRPDAALSRHAFQGNGSHEYRRVRMTNLSLLRMKERLLGAELERRKEARAKRAKRKARQS